MTDEQMIEAWRTRALSYFAAPSEKKRKTILRHLQRCGDWVHVPVTGISTSGGGAGVRNATILAMIEDGDVELRVTQLLSGQRILTLHLASPAPATGGP